MAYAWLASTSSRDGLSRRRAWFAWLLSPRRPCLDVRTLSRHLQRDIGYLDGNDPAGRRE
ncbi:hypothetical protein C7I85_08195 [Mesorhizobium soli]|uniref:Uncharacterized protein n=1 Tax=Pseudaminobacter soli (ex Li et al. 2025) TaxID=1295366 RepID=A0A2P7SIF8_9HYPH|nr:hypothetical protein C7I85_08195 [Mesorhizobium soli]